MTQRHLWIVPSFVFAALLTAAAASSTQSPKRDVVLDLSLANGANPELRIDEDGMGTVESPSLGKFGFVPTIRDANANLVVVEVFDLNRTPNRRIARLELTVGGERVESDTTPRFGVRVVRVVTSTRN
jgi:hypothetical protein